jgi:uncharacterized membrane protein YedE/YeeE
MTEFTPGISSAGGLLIGIAAALLLLGLGRIAGVSGILGNAMLGRAAPNPWRWAFLLGLPIGAAIVATVSGTAGTPLVIRTEPLVLVVAGLLVGFGTQLGSGCTSGHGVCGIARGSKRSIVATLVFMGGGFATVFVVRHLWTSIGGGS